MPSFRRNPLQRPDRALRPHQDASAVPLNPPSGATAEDHSVE